MKKPEKEVIPTVASALSDIQDDLRLAVAAAEEALKVALNAVEAAKKRLKDLG